MTAGSVLTVPRALTFVRKHGIVLMAARGPVPTLVPAIAGGPIRGNWWTHPRARQIYRVLEGVRASPQVLVCRLVQGKLTFVHRRLWPALASISRRLPKAGLAAVREEHTASGRHRVTLVPFTVWLPKAVLLKARQLEWEEAVKLLGPGLPRNLVNHARS